MWKEIAKERYAEIHKAQKLRVFEGFSDPDGTLECGYGRPAMDTSWGIEGEEEAIVKCEMRKNDPNEQEWQYTYYENVKPSH